LLINEVSVLNTVFLEQALLNITRNVRLGFGVFVDKPFKPFISVRPEALDNACYPFGNCSATIGYINRLALTNDAGLFVSTVGSTAITGNLDSVEGGLDALVQAIMCQVRRGNGIAFPILGVET